MVGTSPTRFPPALALRTSPLISSMLPLTIMRESVQNATGLVKDGGIAIAIRGEWSYTFGREADMVQHRRSLPEAVMLATVMVTAAASCKPKDDEKLILALIEEAAILAQQHKVGDILDLVTDTFTANPGARDTDEVRSILAMAFMHYGDFAIKFPNPSIDISPAGDTASVQVPFVILRGGALLPDLSGLVNDPARWAEEATKTADPYHLDLQLFKVDGDWKVNTASLQGLRSLEEI